MRPIGISYEEATVDEHYQDEDKNMKNWYESKTVWFNIIVTVVAILALPEFVAVLSPVWLKYSVLGGAVGNIILRLWFTATGIK